MSASRKKKRDKARKSRANKGVKPTLHKTRSQFKQKH